MVATVGLRRDQIIGAVRRMYTDVATLPKKRFHFPTGRDACRFVGYPDEVLDKVPATALESFAGVGYPFRAGVIREGQRVLDIGAGSGTDSLIAARQVGPRGCVFALDLTPAMTGKLRENVAAAGMANVLVIEGSAESIPLPDACVDVVTSNGVLNLVPDKRKAFAEIYRVLRPGARLQLADVVISRVVGNASRAKPELWAECVVGAVVEEDYLDLFRATGFTDVSVLRHFDYFSGSASPETREIATALGARAAEITMRKPEQRRAPFATQLERLHPATVLRRATQHGLLGLAATGAALIACYGLLALVSLLALLGLTVPVPTAAWAGTIAVLAALVPLALAWSARAHRHFGPLSLAMVGALTIVCTLLLAYDWRIEAAGFAALLSAALWDHRLFHYEC